MVAKKMTNKKKVARGPTQFRTFKAKVAAFESRIVELEKANEELKNVKAQLLKQCDEAIAQREEVVRGLRHVVEGIVGAHALFELFSGRLSTDLSTSDEAKAVRSALQVAGKTGVAVLNKLQPQLSWLGLRRIPSVESTDWNDVLGVAGGEPTVPMEK